MKANTIPCYIFLFLIFFLSGCTNESEKDILLAEMAKRCEYAIHSIDKSSEMLYNIAQYDLSDEFKLKYIDILSSMNKVHEVTNATAQDIDSWRAKKRPYIGYTFQDFPDFSKKINPQLQVTRDSIFSICRTLIRNNGEKYGLKQEEIMELYDEFRENIQIQDTPYSFVTDSVLVDYQLLVILEDIANTQYQIIKQLSTLYGINSGCRWGPFPVIMPEKNIVKLGEVYTAKISIGHYAHPEGLRDYQILVDNTPLELDENGWGIYHTRATTSGERNIQIKYEMLNRLTGEVYDYKSNSFKYTITSCD